MYQNVSNDKSIHEEDDIVTKDQYINIEVNINRGDENYMERATVKKRVSGINGIPIGKAHKSCLLDSRQFEVEYNDGITEILSAHIIEENILAQVDDQGQMQLLLEKIIDHWVSGDAKNERDHKDSKKRYQTKKRMEIR